MAHLNPRAVRTAPARACSRCHAWPCRCAGTVNPDTMEFSFRNERCACGGPRIISGGSSTVVAVAIDAHNQTPAHRAWRKRKGIEGGKP